MSVEAIEKAKEHFGQVLAEQLERVEAMKRGQDWMSYAKLQPILIGIVGGDGIGPFICRHAHHIPVSYTHLRAHET